MFSDTVGYGDTTYTVMTPSRREEKIEKSRKSKRVNRNRAREVRALRTKSENFCRALLSSLKSAGIESAIDNGHT
jgi:hypothetical protein